MPKRRYFLRTIRLSNKNARSKYTDLNIQQRSEISSSNENSIPGISVGTLRGEKELGWPFFSCLTPSHPSTSTDLSLPQSANIYNSLILVDSYLRSQKFSHLNCVKLTWIVWNSLGLCEVWFDQDKWVSHNPSERTFEKSKVWFNQEKRVYKCSLLWER